MKNSKKNFGLTGQRKTDIKKPQKHDANLQKNSTVYFQIGLILCLLATYGLFEMRFQQKVIVPETPDSNELALIDVAPLFVEEVSQPEEPKPIVERASKLIDTYVPVEDLDQALESQLMTPEADFTNDPPIDPGSLSDPEDPEDPEEFVPFTFIETVPIFPGCEKYDTNDKRRKCMSKKISKLVGKTFNTQIGSEHGMTGELRIQTQFTIDKEGHVTDIKTRGPHPALEQEAKRVINKIPKMQPGYQRDRPVGVIYTLPITFYVQY